MRSIYVPAQNGSGRPDSRGCCGSWERQEGCLGGLRCGGLRAHLRKKIATARSVRRGDRLLLTRQCRPENGYHGRARGDGGERDSDPSPTKTQRQARKRRTRSQSAIARMHVAAVRQRSFGRHRRLRQISIAVLPSRSSCWHDVLHVLCDNAILLAFDDNPKALESEAKRTGCIVPNCLLA